MKEAMDDRIDPAWRKEEIIEKAKGGRSITTRYVNEAGELMRQDVMIEVDRGAFCRPQTGLKAAFRRIVQAGRQAMEEFDAKRS